MLIDDKINESNMESYVFTKDKIVIASPFYEITLMQFLWILTVAFQVCVDSQPKNLCRWFDILGHTRGGPL